MDELFLTDAERAESKRILRAHGLKGLLQVVADQPDELIFLVDPLDAARMNGREMTRALQAALHRKVAITTAAPIWLVHAVPL